MACAIRQSLSFLGSRERAQRTNDWAMMDVGFLGLVFLGRRRFMTRAVATA